jgi:hypothetical protein
MANPIVITCPDCAKQIKAPPEAAGKKIRCKGCGCVFPVPEGETAAPAAKAKPAPAKPAAKPVVKRDDDDDEGPKQYGMKEEDTGVARCAFCAGELEPGAVICLQCGYNTVTRRRHESKTTFDTTGGDRFMWLLPGIACVLGIAGLVTFDVFVLLNAKEWMKDSWFDNNDGTFLVKPGILPFYAILISCFIAYPLGRFAIKRLFINYTPPEVIKH